MSDFEQAKIGTLERFKLGRGISRVAGRLIGFSEPSRVLVLQSDVGWCVVRGWALVSCGGRL